MFDFLKHTVELNVPLLRVTQTKEGVFGLCNSMDTRAKVQLVCYQATRRCQVLSVTCFVLVFQLNLP